MQDTSIQLVERWRRGDETAAEEIFDRYVTRLLALAASRLSPALQRRLEADDIVQSVYRSFFTRVADGRLDIAETGQLWGLLAAITVNKVRKVARFHQADKRTIEAEASATGSLSCHGLNPEQLAREPTADEAVMLAEQYNQVLNQLSPLGQQVLEHYLANESVEAIAKRVRRSARTVRRELEQIRAKLLNELDLAAQ